MNDFKIDYRKLKERCRATFADYARLEGMQVWASPPTTDANPHPVNQRRFLFQDNGAKILAVAHLDTVNNCPSFLVGDVNNKRVIFTRAADDRLGAYLILDLLPKILGRMPYDILFTEGEETGQSTGKLFNAKPPGYYQWLFECDRNGTDVVGYDYYSDPRWLPAAKAAGWTSFQHGAFTDIGAMTHMLALGWNFGVGYTDNHGEMSRIVVDDLIACTKRIATFIEQNEQVSFPFEKKAVSYSTGPYGNGSYHYNGQRKQDHDGDGYEDWPETYLGKPIPKSRNPMSWRNGDWNFYLTCSACGQNFWSQVDNEPMCDVCLSALIKHRIAEQEIEEVVATNTNNHITWKIAACAQCGKEFFDLDPMADLCGDCQTIDKEADKPKEDSKDDELDDDTTDALYPVGSQVEASFNLSRFLLTGKEESARDSTIIIRQYVAGVVETITNIGKGGKQRFIYGVRFDTDPETVWSCHENWIAFDPFRVKNPLKVRVDDKVVSKSPTFDKGGAVVPKGTHGIVRRILGRRLSVQFDGYEHWVTCAQSSVDKADPVGKQLTIAGAIQALTGHKNGSVG